MVLKAKTPESKGIGATIASFVSILHGRILISHVMCVVSAVCIVRLASVAGNVAAGQGGGGAAPISDASGKTGAQRSRPLIRGHHLLVRGAEIEGAGAIHFSSLPDSTMHANHALSSHE